VPPVVVVDELKAGILVERCRIAQLREEFYAITRSRKLQNQLLVKLMSSQGPLRPSMTAAKRQRKARH
jgi:LysR family transcriptional activator of nhaA